MDFTKEQLSDVFVKHLDREKGLQDLMELMIEYLRADAEQWLSRSLESYYPIVFVDAIHIKIHRKRSVENEAFYVVMAVKEDKTREVITSEKAWNAWQLLCKKWGKDYCKFRLCRTAFTVLH